MEYTFKTTIPGVAYSQLEVVGTVDNFIDALKEVASRIEEIPEIFFADKDTVVRLNKANNALIKLQETHPEIKNTLLQIKEGKI